MAEQISRRQLLSCLFGNLQTIEMGDNSFPERTCLSLNRRGFIKYAMILVGWIIGKELLLSRPNRDTCGSGGISNLPSAERRESKEVVPEESGWITMQISDPDQRDEIVTTLSSYRSEKALKIPPDVAKRISQKTRAELDEFVRVYIPNESERHAFCEGMKGRGLSVQQEYVHESVIRGSGQSQNLVVRAYTKTGQSDTLPDLSRYEITRNDWVGFIHDEAQRRCSGQVVGKGVRVITIEAGINYDHVELAGTNWISREPLYGQPSGQAGGVAHGTADASLIVGQQDGIGMNGFAPSAEFGFASYWKDEHSDTANSILACISYLRPGDILLVELQTWGPYGEYCPITYKDDVRAAVHAAYEAGIIVVIPAGNGGQDLNHSKYQGRFGFGDYTYILVGQNAGGSRNVRATSNYHTRPYYPSMYWAAGPGNMVVTAGYSDIHNPCGEVPDCQNYLYGWHNGTSAASASVAGALAAIQGYRKVVDGRTLTLEELWEDIIEFGSRQQGDTSRLIGPLPNALGVISRERLPELIRKGGHDGGGFAQPQCELTDKLTDAPEVKLYLNGPGDVNFIDFKIPAIDDGLVTTLVITDKDGSVIVESSGYELLTDGWVRFNFDRTELLGRSWYNAKVTFSESQKVAMTQNWQDTFWSFNPTIGFVGDEYAFRIGLQVKSRSITLRWAEPTYLNGNVVSETGAKVRIIISKDPSLEHPVAVYNTSLSSTRIRVRGLQPGTYYWGAAVVQDDDVQEAPYFSQDEPLGVFGISNMTELFLPIVHVN